MTSGVAWAPVVVPSAVGVLIASAVVVGAGHAPRTRARSLRPPSIATALGRLVVRAEALGRPSRPRRGVARTDAARDVQVVITQVAGLVRSGMPPERAWAGVGLSAGPDGAPSADDLTRLTDDRSQARAVVAACRLAHQVGAPIAPVLDSIVSTLVIAAEGAAERDTALASPRSTARLLLWLPAVGVAVSTVLGAGPLSLLLGGGPAAAAPVVGTVLLVVGRAWTRRLVRSATESPQGA